MRQGQGTLRAWICFKLERSILATETRIGRLFLPLSPQKSLKRRLFLAGVFIPEEMEPEGASVSDGKVEAHSGFQPSAPGFSYCL